MESLEVICVADPPATGIVQISKFPLRFDAKAIVLPSGDQHGSPSAEVPVVTCQRRSAAVADEASIYIEISTVDERKVKRFISVSIHAFDQ